MGPLAQVKDLEHPSSDVTALLKASVMFRDASDSLLSQVALRLIPACFSKGHPIFIAGEVSTSIYFVKSGQVDILSYNSELRKLTPVRRIGAGEYFSEFSVLTQSNHSTSCFAVEDTELLLLDKKAFFELVIKHPGFAKDLVLTLAKANQHLTHSSNYIEYYKEENFRFSEEVAQLCPLGLLAKFEVLPVCFENNTLWVALVDPYNKNFFQMFRSAHPKIDLKISLISPSDFQRVLDEMPAYYSGEKSAKDVVRRPVKEDQPTTAVEQVIGLLRVTAIFSKLDDRYLRQLVPHFVMKRYKAGQDIFTQGSPSETFFTIWDGTVDLIRTEAGKSTSVATLGQYDSFGEISLIAGGTHSILARARTDTNLYCLSKEVIQKLLAINEFSFALAVVLARRLQVLNHQIHWKYYSGKAFHREEVRVDILPLSVMKNHRLIPFDASGDTISLGLVQPNEEEIYQIINRYLAGQRVHIFKISQEDFELAYSAAQGLSDVPSKLKKKSIKLNRVMKSDQNAIHFVDDVLSLGVAQRASDIHVEPHLGHFSVRYRIDGFLRELHERVDTDFGLMIINRVKILAELDTAENRKPQDGELNVQLPRSDVQARVSCVPTKFGEKVVLRLIHTHSSPIPLSVLAPDREVIKFLREITLYQQGVFLVTGPTGSGKTTTLYSLLSELNNVSENVVTVEDPVELILPGVTQIQTNEKAGVGFSSILRNILRQDPDVIMIGEIRDVESAQLAFEAGLTGHLVLASIHANNSLDVVQRLNELKVSHQAIGNGLVGVISQRLLPQICPHCKVSRPITGAEKAFFEAILKPGSAPSTVFEGRGCSHCFDDGVLGRIPVFEYWCKSHESRRILLKPEPDSDALLKAVAAEGFRPIDEFGLRMVINGFTTVESVKRLLYGIETRSIAKKAS